MALRVAEAVRGTDVMVNLFLYQAAITIIVSCIVALTKCSGVC
jgi:hypothetical protein